MPINATAEYYVAEKKYLEARTKEEKIAALKEMIKELPKHKGTHNLLAQLKKRLSRLKSESKKSAKKESQKFNKEYPLVAMFDDVKEIKIDLIKYVDAFIQLAKFPMTFNEKQNSIFQMSDIVVLAPDQKHLAGICTGKKILLLDKNENIEELKSKIWQNLDVIQVYTKSPGKNRQLPAVILKKGAKVKNLAERIHKDFIKDFKFARIFNSTKFSGRKVGLDYILDDGDVVEFHI